MNDQLNPLQKRLLLQTETNSGGKCGGQRYICTHTQPTCKTMLHTLLLTMPY